MTNDRIVNQTATNIGMENHPMASLSPANGNAESSVVASEDLDNFAVRVPSRHKSGQTLSGLVLRGTLE